MASAAGHALLFQCAVPSVRSELRPAPAPLDALSDEELVAALQTVAD